MFVSSELAAIESAETANLRLPAQER